MALRTELLRPVNPYEVRRPHSSEEIELLFRKERLLIDKKIMVGFGHMPYGIIAFITADETLPFTTEHFFTRDGLREAKNKTLGVISTADLYLPDREKIFFGIGEYEVQYLGRDAVSAVVKVSSIHPFSFEKVEIARNVNANAYLRTLSPVLR